MDSSSCRMASVERAEKQVNEFVAREGLTEGGAGTEERDCQILFTFSSKKVTVLWGKGRGENTQELAWVIRRFLQFPPCRKMTADVTSAKRMVG